MGSKVKSRRGMRKTDDHMKAHAKGGSSLGQANGRAGDKGGPVTEGDWKRTGPMTESGPKGVGGRNIFKVDGHRIKITSLFRAVPHEGPRSE